MLGTPVGNYVSLESLATRIDPGLFWEDRITWKPSSVFKRPFIVLLLAQPYELLIRLYEHIMVAAPA